MTETAPRGTPVEEQTLGELVATMSRDLSLLVHKEAELAKTEIAASAKRAGLGAGFLGGAGFVGIFALAFVSIAAALGIDEGAGWPWWSGFAIIGALYGGLALMLGLLGLRKVTRVTPPERTIQTVKDDLAWVKHPTVAPNRELEELRATHAPGRASNES